VAKYQIETENGTYEIETEEPAAKFPLDPSVMNEPGLQDVSLTPITKPDFEQAGENIATSKFGQKHPVLGAAIGTPVSMPEEFISAATGLKAVPEMAAGVRGAGSLVKRLGKSLLSGPNAEEISAAQQALKNLPIKERGIRNSLEELNTAAQKGFETFDPEIEAAKQKLKDLPLKYKQKQSIIEELDKAIRPQIGKAESEAGLAMNKIPEAAKDTTDFANTMKAISEKSSEELLTSMETSGLQNLKKIAQVTKRGNLLPEEEAFINKGVAKIDEAIAKAHPKVAEELSKFREIQDVKTGLPKEAKAEKERLISLINKLKSTPKRAPVGEELQKFNEIQDALKSLPEETKAKKEALMSLVQRLKTEAKGSTSGKVRNLIGTALRYGTIGAGLGGIHKLMK